MSATRLLAHATMLAWVALLAGGALAEVPARTALHWVRARGAEGCIDGRALAQRVEALTGPLFAPPAEAERSLEASIAPAGRGFEVRIKSVTAGGREEGERVLRFDQPDCRALDEAVGFVIALTVDPELALGALPPSLLGMFAEERSPEESLLAELERTPPAPVILPEPEPAPPAVEAPSPPAPGVKPRRRFEALLAAAVLGRTVPHWAAGLEAALRLALRERLALALTARAFPRSRSLSLGAEREARFAAYLLSLSLCPGLVRRAPLQVAPCAGAELGLIEGRGRGFDDDRRALRWDPAVTASVIATWALPARYGLYAQAGLRIRLREQGFTFVRAGSPVLAFEPERVGVSIGIGASRAF